MTEPSQLTSSIAIRVSWRSLDSRSVVVDRDDELVRDGIPTRTFDNSNPSAADDFISSCIYFRNSFSTKSPRPEHKKRSSSQAATSPPYLPKQWRIHTVSFWTSSREAVEAFFYSLLFDRPRIEQLSLRFTVSVADAVFTRPLIGYALKNNGDTRSFCKSPRVHCGVCTVAIWLLTLLYIVAH